MINSVIYMGKNLVGKWLPAHNLPIAAISFSDPGSARPSFSWHSGPLLELSFHDVRNEFYDEPSILPGPTKEIAESIAGFVQEIQDDQLTFNLLVNCHEGSSRSAAVAKYVSEKYGVVSYSPMSLDLTCHNRSLFNYLVAHASSGAPRPAP